MQDTMEIEKKYLVKKLPDSLEQYDSTTIEQGYLCTRPVVRIRRRDEDFILTYKSKKDAEGAAVCVNIENEMPLTREAYEHLQKKIDGILIQKTRYVIPWQGHKIELDVFHGRYEGMVLAEVEFDSLESAECFEVPDWFGENVSGDYHYTNAYLAYHPASVSQTHESYAG